jgi:hypothetical protein
MLRAVSPSILLRTVSLSNGVSNGFQGSRGQKSIRLKAVRF